MTVKRVSKDPPAKRALTRQRLNTLERRTSDRQEKMRRKRKLDVLEALRKLAKDVKSKKLNIPKMLFPQEEVPLLIILIFNSNLDSIDASI